MCEDAKIRGEASSLVVASSYGSVELGSVKLEWVLKGDGGLELDRWL